MASFREIKIALTIDVLRCLTPPMTERELRMHFVAYNLIRCVMQKAALARDVDLRRLSFKGCLDTLRQSTNAISAANDEPGTISAIIEEMLHDIANDLNPLRPGRSEPRVRIRGPKNYRLLTKPHREMGLLPHRKIGVPRGTPMNLISKNFAPPVPFEAFPVPLRERWITTERSSDFQLRPVITHPRQASS